jgi:hypothetical protein
MEPVEAAAADAGGLPQPGRSVEGFPLSWSIQDIIDGKRAAFLRRRAYRDGIEDQPIRWQPRGDY